AGARLVTRGATRGVVASRGTEAARRALEGVNTRARRSPSLPKAPARKGSTAGKEARVQQAERRATTAQKVGAYVAARSATRRGLTRRVRRKGPGGGRATARSRAFAATGAASLPAVASVGAELEDAGALNLVRAAPEAVRAYATDPEVRKETGRALK